MSQVMEVLRGAEIDGNKVRIVQQLDQKLYAEVAKLLKKYGAKWNRKEQANIIPDAYLPQFLEDLSSGQLRKQKSIQQEIGFFPTPMEYAEILVRRVSSFIPGGMVLEPSAGHGALIDAALAYRPDGINAIESFRANFEVLLEKYKENPFVSFGQMDFLETVPVPNYDVVLMNPPFGKNQGAKHLLHALRYLKPTGHLAAIMPAGVEHNSDQYNSLIRRFVRDSGEQLERQPNGAFAESGTNVATTYVFIAKEVVDESLIPSFHSPQLSVAGSRPNAQAQVISSTVYPPAPAKSSNVPEEVYWQWFLEA